MFISDDRLMVEKAQTGDGRAIDLVPGVYIQSDFVWTSRSLEIPGKGKTGRLHCDYRRGDRRGFHQVSRTDNPRRV